MADTAQVDNPVEEVVKYKDIFLSVDRVETLPSRVDDQDISNESELIGITENDQPVPLVLGTDYERTIKKYKAFPHDLTEVEYTPTENKYDFTNEGTAYFIYYSLKDTMKARTAPDIVANFEKNNRRIIESYTPDEDKRHANPSFLHALIHDYEITTKKKEAINEDISELFYDFDLIHKYFQEEDPNDANASDSFKEKMAALNITQFEQSTLQDNDGDGLWKINANIYKLFDRLVKKVPEIQERMRTKSVDYNLKRWDDFVTEYLKTKGKDSAEFNLSEEKKIFYEEFKAHNVSDQQKKELYALKWYTRYEKDEEKFEVKVDITTDKGTSNISFGKNYKVDDEVIFLKPDGKTYVKEGQQEVRVYWIDARGNNNKKGSTLGYQKGLTTRIEKDNMYDTFKASGTEDDSTSRWFWGTTVATGKKLGPNAGGKRITRRKHKQKRRSTRKRR